MVAQRHNPSRRALLGAALAIPFVGREAPPPASGRSPSPAKAKEDRAWRAAAAAAQRAEAAFREIERRSAGASHAEQLALEEPFGERLDGLYAAIRRVMAVPAPDVAALALKISLVVDHEVFELHGGAARMEALKRDALRLCFEGRRA